MKFKNVLLVVTAAVVFGSVAEAAQAGPMAGLEVTGPVLKRASEERLSTLKLYRHTSSGDVYAEVPFRSYDTEPFTPSLLLVQPIPKEKGFYYVNGKKRESANSPAIEAVSFTRAITLLAHAHYTTRWIRLAAIAALIVALASSRQAPFLIAALTSWRAYKHRNLLVGANESTPETEDQLASLPWYDRESVKAARALEYFISS